MRKDIISFLEKDVKEKCESTSNFFGIGVYYHIKAVVQNALLLAKEYSADIEIVTIASWLHDYASITDYKYYEEHHIQGAKMAKEILQHMDYHPEKIKHVQKCILNHRGSTSCIKKSVEEICVGDADAISHFDSIPALFYLAYVKRGYSIEEGMRFVADKLTRSYAKLSDRSKVMYQEKYISALQIVSGK